MKSMLFGLALLAALPGCCGMWKCKKDKCDVKSSKMDSYSDKSMRRYDKGNMVEEDVMVEKKVVRKK